jgi:D-lactate dehydrogenase (cytochrome)
MAGPDGAAQEAAESIELGFRCVKFKVGYPHVEQDRAVIGAARGAAGKDLQVMVDYNQSLSVPEAIGRVQLLEEEALVWVEEPTRADDFAGHARIAAECRTPIQIGENLWGPHDLTKSLSVGASDFVMLERIIMPVTAESVDHAARDAAIASLRQLLGARLSSAAPVREQHGKDASYHPCVPPDAVAFAQSTAEVSEIVKLCARHKVPIIPFGAGTGVEGNVVALRGGVCIDISRMNQIRQVSAGDLDATVEAGVTHEQLNEHLRDSGLFFSVDPGANATIGGMAATRASGTNSVRYGTMRENVLSLTVVLPDGRVIRTARRARKSAAGYDLTRLFVGSEGTLGVITEVTVRLYGIPAAISAAVCSFASIEAAVNAVIQTIQAGVPVARIEVANAMQMDAINKYSKLDLPVAPTLWLEFHGTEASVAEQAEIVQKIAAAHGGANFSWTTRPEDRQKLWRARHDVVYADKALRPGGQIFATDVCVPISRLAECIVATEKDIAASFLPAPIVGHVGDGNFHLVIVLNPNDPREMAEAERLNERLVHRALSLDGTCTGEHGIGCGKIDFLLAEHGEAVSVMRAIKKAIDPDNIMNPGKILRI